MLILKQWSLNQIQYFYCMASTWYGKSASRQFQSLLETKPKLHQLLALPEFAQQLKAYNSKLIEYITNTPALISEAITYLTVNPQHFDSDDRKYKLPLQVIELIETQTPCILNGFFKQADSKDRTNLDLLFGMLEQKQILPLLAGYFFRTNICLLNNRCKEITDYVYSKPQIFNALIAHSDHLVISNALQLFLNLEMSKNPTSLPERITIKLDAIKAIVGKIESLKTFEQSKGSLILENMVNIFIETIDKYYFILDGKQMMEAITVKPTIRLMVELIGQKRQMALPAIAFFVALINYCSFSSVNSGQPDHSEAAMKSIERLQNLPVMVQLLNFFPLAIDKISSCSKMDLYHYKLLQMLCHCISISSKRVFQKIREVNLFGCLITLMFKHEQNNVLHMLIEKSFYHVCVSERRIYEQYRKYLFCELDVIELTVNRISKMFREEKFMEEASKKGYFGHFMKIVKIYAKMEHTDLEISAVFRRKAALWNRIQSILTKPYDAICLKELGCYENVPSPICQQYTVNKQTNITTNRQENSSTILQIQKQEQFPRSNSTANSNKKEDTGKHNYLFDSEPVSLKNKVEPQPISKEELDKTKAESFKQFMTKQKTEAEKQIKLKKSISAEKKLSGSSRGKMISPSSGKKNSWREDKSEQKSSEAVLPKVANIPKVPTNRHHNSSINDHIVPKERENRFMQQQRKASKSVNMEEIKKIKVHLIDPPKQKKYRKADEKDQMFLDFLGLSN